MAHEVFISYSSKDKLIADAICTNLEVAGIRCWIAPRDIIPGLDWPTSISNAIAASRMMVLVLSAHSNASAEVSRELFLAADKNLIIIPFKIDNIVPEPGKDYYLARTHWLDAMNPPTQEQIDRLVVYARSFLSIGTTQPTSDDPVREPVHPSTAPIPPAAQPVKPARKIRWVWALPLVLVLAGGGIYGILSNLPGNQPALSTVTPTIPPSPISLTPTASLVITPSALPATPPVAQQTEIETLCADLTTLVKQSPPTAAWTFTAEITPAEKDVSIKLDSFLSGEHQATQSFRIPGEYTCVATQDTGGFLVELHADEYWNLGPYDETIATAICEKFSRLNTLLKE